MEAAHHPGWDGGRLMNTVYQETVTVVENVVGF